ncbi:MAG: BREX system P-loop protein BrxC [Bryobacterales bacterium]|nr:BREX system P-loop protein BrxC [Bryobacterales bacterium]
MRIQNLFQKDIFRPINGVVKADQLDASSVWQELEEFVVTKELDRHLRRFFSVYCEAMDKTGDPEVAGKIGVWVSGFFGSGKSHFIKVLCYLLNNKDHTHHGQTRRAVEFFDSKIKDAILLGDIKRAVASHSEVILFNIDSKADSRSGQDAILAVFLKVLNELAGYSGDHPHIAHMERYLESKGRLGVFQDAYQALTGTRWIEERDAYAFNRDEVIKALAHTLGQSRASCEKWIDGAEENFALTIENFCKWVKDYLDGKGKDHRIVFLVDEVGQFIGTDTRLMLNLQTVTEELGTVCMGRAWVVVTSQEDIDAVLGEMRGTRASDFSKIQGRFRTRLSLSSANVDEVIQERLLAKREEVRADLEAEYASQGDILKNQLSFKDVGTTFPQFKDADDFVRQYPFAPYQFKLLQKIFESIRKAGATGLHLAQGERSLLDAFQNASQSVSAMEVGILVPLYRFYSSIEGFLDTTVKRTIDHAGDNASLEEFDTRLLEVLFLIRYVDEVKGNVENLVTLCLDQIDSDRFALRKKIEAGLQRLERETLVNRSGDTYFFLTSEERDINREIKNIELSSAEEARLLGALVFDDVLKGQRKHRFSANRMDFSFNRICDEHVVGNRVEGGLNFSVVTPLDDDYELYQDDGKCVLKSSQDDGQVFVRLRNNESLGRELRAYMRTDKYVRTRDDGTLPPTTKRIHSDLSAENRIRRDRLTRLLAEMLADAGYFVAGQRLEVTADAPQKALSEAMEYLIRNTFNKMGYLETLSDDPVKEIQAVLRSNDIARPKLDMAMPESNPQAMEDLRRYIELCMKTSRQIVLFDMVNARYVNRPYGWPAHEVILLLARLIMAGEVQCVTGGAAIPKDRLYEALTTQRKWRNITVVQRARSKPEDVKKARELGRDVFSEMGPEGEEALFEFLKGWLERWREKLSRYRALADTGSYPGAEDIAESLSLLNMLMAPQDSYRFLEQINERGSELRDLAEVFHDLDHFYEHQRPMWDKLGKAASRFELNRMELERDDSAGSALRRMGEILVAPSPYGLVQEAERLIRTVSEVNEELLSVRRAKALAAIAEQTALVSAEVSTAGGDKELETTCLTPMENLAKQVSAYESLAHIDQAESESVRLKDKALTRIERYLARKAEEGKAEQDKPAIRLRRVVSPVKLVKSAYLESQADVDSFLDDLRTELNAALARNERIEIR